MIIDERRTLAAIRVFDLEDAFARDRRLGGPHPRPFEPIRFSLLGGTMAGVETRFDPPLSLVVRRNGSGYHLFFGRVRLADGTIVQQPLPEGAYRLRIESGLYRPTELANVDLPASDPSTPYAVDLLPGVGYPFPVPAALTSARVPTLLRGTVRQTDGRPVADALVKILAEPAVEPYRTDTSGQWVLLFPDDQPAGLVTLSVTVPTTTGTVTITRSVPIVPGATSMLGETGLRGQVLDGAGLPIRGAAVTVAGRPGRSTTDGAGAWSYYFGADQPDVQVTLTTTLRDGRALNRSAVPVRYGVLGTVDPFRFE